ncbi:MAG: 2Fe-2S iron-sulfur cluster-binding protein [Rhodospirillales bacterium]
MSRYRSIGETRETVQITVDGGPLAMPRGQSLLAALLVAGVSADFHCAIGQCQRCLVRVDGRVETACLYVPKGGEAVDTSPPDSRVPP